jgi:hypothetical protein
MFVHYMEGHLVSGHHVMLTSDTDPAVAVPPGYVWLSDGARGGGGAARGLSQPAQQALVATVTVAAAAAAVLLGLLVVTSTRRRRAARRETEAKQLGAAAAGGGYAALQLNGGGGGGSSGMNGQGGGTHAAAVGSFSGSVGVRSAGSASASGGAAPGSNGPALRDAFSDGGGASGRWRQLLLAINTRVADIHAKRLAAGLSAGGAGSSSVSGSGGSDPLPLLLRGALAGAAGAGAGAAASHSQQLAQLNPCFGELPDPLGDIPPIVAGGGGDSYTIGRSASSFRSASWTRSAPRHGQPQQLQLMGTLGSGSFGTVFRARWHGAEVAVKLVQLPTKLLGGSGAAGGEGGAEAAAFASTRERMAVQEAAISTTMTHPNIVALYCIGLRGVQAGSAAPGERAELWEGEEAAAWEAAAAAAAAGADGEGGVVVAWELQLSE